MSMGTSMGDGNSFSFKSRLYQVGCTVVQQCDVACSLVLFAKKPSAFARCYRWPGVYQFNGMRRSSQAMHLTLL